MGACLLVSHQKVLHPTLTLSDMKSVVNREDRSPRIAKYRVDPMATQGIHQGSRARNLTRHLNRLRSANCR